MNLRNPLFCGKKILFERPLRQLVTQVEGHPRKGPMGKALGSKGLR